MVHITSTSLAVLLGSAALTSAAALPARRDGEGHTLMGKRTWRGRHGVRGPLRNGEEHYLINVDLTGDGANHNGHGDLIDINTRNLLGSTDESEKQGDLLRWHLPTREGQKRDLRFTAEEEELIRAELKSHMRRNEPLVSVSHGNIHPSDPLVDAHIIAELQQRDDHLLDLAAKIFVGSSRQKRDEIDLSTIEAAAKAVGVSDEQIADAKNAVDSLSPDQKLEVENAVRHAMWATAKPGEKRAIPIFTDENADTARNPTTVKVNLSTRSEEDDMGGAPGYIDITSPMFNSTGQKIASLVLATNGSSENSTFVLNASSSVRTKVFMVPINSTDSETSDKEHVEGEPIKVNLKVPVFVADSAKVEPFCATFDPSPNAPEPMTVEPCEEPEDERSQIFLYDPETGSVKPNWTPTEENKQILDKVSDDVSAEMASASASMSSAVLSVSSMVPTASAPASFAAQSASSSVPTEAPSPTSTSVEAAESSSSPIPSGAASETSSSVDTLATSSLPELPSVVPSPTASAVVSVSEALSSAIPTSSAVASVSEIIPASAETSISSVAASPSVSEAPVPFASAQTSSSDAVPASASSAVALASASPSTAGKDIDLVFTPSHASVMSVEDEKEQKSVSVKSYFQDGPAQIPGSAEHVRARSSEDDCEETLLPLSVPAPSAAPAISAKPKAKTGAKLPEDQKHDNGSKLNVGNGQMKVQDIQSLNGRLGARFLRRQQQTFMAPRDVTAPYE